MHKHIFAHLSGFVCSEIINTVIKNNLGMKGFIWLINPTSQSTAKGNQGRRLREEPEGRH